MNRYFVFTAGLLAVILLAAAPLRAQSQSIESNMERGTDLLRQGAYDQSVSAFRTVLAQDSRHFEAQYNLALAYLQMGRYGNSVDEFQKALRLNPRSVNCWANLGVAYDRMGKPQQSLDALSKSVSCDPQNVDARLNFAIMLANLNQYDRAIAEYREVIVMDPARTDARLNLGKCLIAKGYYPEATRVLKDALATNPNLAEAHFELGNIYSGKNKEPYDALIEYRKAIDLAPDNIEFYTNLGTLLEQLDSVQAAIAIWRSYLIYVNDPNEKGRVEQRISKLSSGGTAAEEEVESAISRAETERMRDELRGTTAKKPPSKQLEVAPVDIIGDLNEMKTDNGFDIKKELEAKKLRRKGLQ